MSRTCDDSLVAQRQTVMRATVTFSFFWSILKVELCQQQAWVEYGCFEMEGGLKCDGDGDVVVDDQKLR